MHDSLNFKTINQTFSVVLDCLGTGGPCGLDGHVLGLGYSKYITMDKY